MSVLSIETQSVANLNILMLFLVAVEPYLLNLFRFSGDFLGLGYSSFQGFLELFNNLDFVASTLFALDLGLLYLVLGFFDHILAKQESKKAPPENVKKIQAEPQF